MNARQRRYLIASLKSLSVIFVATYLAALALGWLLAAQFLDFRHLSSPLTLALLGLVSGGALWLAHFVTLGKEPRGWTLSPGALAAAPADGECPSWPTILAWLVTDLEGEEAHRISSHVSTCDNCRKRLALMSAVQEMSSDRGR